MADNQVSNKLKFISNRPQDTMDVTFRIVGHELKWLAPQAQENAWGRIWKVLRKQDLPKEMIDDLESRHHNIFQGSDTIRRNELVLAYAPKEAVDAVRGENSKAAKEQMDAIYTRHKQGTKHISLDPKETGFEKVGPEHFNS